MVEPECGHVDSAVEDFGDGCSLADQGLHGSSDLCVGAIDDGLEIGRRHNETT